MSFFIVFFHRIILAEFNSTVVYVLLVPGLALCFFLLQLYQVFSFTLQIQYPLRDNGQKTAEKKSDEFGK